MLDCDENCGHCFDIRCRCQDCIYLSGTLKDLFCDYYNKPCEEINTCEEVEE